MTTKQKKFVEGIKNGLEPVQAAIEAGFSPKQAQRKSRELMRDPAIQAATKPEKSPPQVFKAPKKSGPTEDGILARLWDEANDFSDTSTPAARVRALQLLGSKMGIFQPDNEQDPFSILERTLPGESGRRIVDILARRVEGALAGTATPPEDATIPDSPGPVREGSSEDNVVEKADGNSPVPDQASVPDAGQGST